MKGMSEKRMFPEAASVEIKPAIIPVEGFQADLKEQILELLEKKEMIDFNNQAKMEIFLERLGDYWQKKENNDFALLHKSLGVFDESLKAEDGALASLSKEEQARLFNIFNKALIDNREGSVFSFFVDYVEEFPARQDDYNLFKPLSFEDGKRLNIDKKDLRRTGFESAELSFNLYLDYLGALRNSFKKDLFNEFNDKENSSDNKEEGQESLYLSLEEIDAFVNARRLQTKDFTTGVEEKRNIKKFDTDNVNPLLRMESLTFHPDNIVLKKKDLANMGFSAEDRAGLESYLNNWFDYLEGNQDWSKLNAHFYQVLDLKRKLKDKEKNIYQQRVDFVRNPDKYRAKIKNSDLLEYWFGKGTKPEDARGSRALGRLSNREKEEFLAALGNDELLEFTVDWASKLAEDRLGTLNRKSGYLKAYPDQMEKLRELVGELLQLWPDDMSFYDDEEKDEIKHAWFRPYEPRQNDEGLNGKFIRLDYLLRNADNPESKMFVKDENTFNRLLGELNELISKEIVLDHGEYKILREMVLDNGFAKTLENEKFESLLEDIYENEALTMVQENLWNELLDALGDDLKEKIGVYVHYEDNVREDWALMNELEADLGLEFGEAKAYSVKDLKEMFDYYKELEKPKKKKS